MKEWNREQTAASTVDPKPFAATVLSDSLLFRPPPKAKTCGHPLHGASVTQLLMTQLEPWLAQVVVAAQQHWSVVRMQFEAASVSACTPHCNVCDFSGLVGMITMTTRITNTKHNYLQDLTQSYFVGGPPTILQSTPAVINYPAELVITKSGHWDLLDVYDDKGNPAKDSQDWKMSASSPLDCAPAAKAVCFQIRSTASGLTITEISSQFTTDNGGVKSINYLGQPGFDPLQTDEVRPDSAGVILPPLTGSKH